MDGLQQHLPTAAPSGLQHSGWPVDQTHSCDGVEMHTIYDVSDSVQEQAWPCQVHAPAPAQCIWTS